MKAKAIRESIKEQGFGGTSGVLPPPTHIRALLGTALHFCEVVEGHHWGIPETLHPKPLTLDSLTAVVVLASCTFHPTPYTLHPTPYTLHPTLYTLHLSPYTLHLSPYRCTSLIRDCHPLEPYSRPIPRSLQSYELGTHVHPSSCAFHPTPYTLHPTPYILHPTPYTLRPSPHTHPKPSTLLSEEGTT